MEKSDTQLKFRNQIFPTCQPISAQTLLREVPSKLLGLRADVFALHLKTKHAHWHMYERHFRDYHLLLDEQSAQIFTMTNDIAEREINETTLRSIATFPDNNVTNVAQCLR